MGHEDAVVAPELEEQVVAGDGGDRARLDTAEAGDAVVLVDDVVAGAHVEEGREARAGGEALLARRGAQQRALVDHGQLQSGGHEALAQGGGEEVEARGGLTAAGQPLAAHDLGAQGAKPVRGALRLALVAEGDEDAVAVAHQAREVALGAGEVAGRELRPRSVELQGLVALHEVHPQGAGEEGAGFGERHVEPLAHPRALDRHADLGVELGQRPVGLVGVEHGHRQTGGGEDVGDGREAAGQRRQSAHAGAPKELVRSLLPALALPGGDRLAPARLVLRQGRVGLARSVDRRPCEGAAGALRVHREGAQALHLVAPEFDAQRVAEGRVRIDKAAAHSVFPT